MYKDAKSWDPGFIQKRPDGSLMAGGRWMGGRAYLVCATEADQAGDAPAEPARHPGAVRHRMAISSTRPMPSVPRNASTPSTRSAATRTSPARSSSARRPARRSASSAASAAGSGPCRAATSSRGWSAWQVATITISSPRAWVPRVIPFWEMVYHDCEVCYGKYGYAAGRSAEYVAHHLLAARPLNYHSIPDHLYWKAKHETRHQSADQACYTRTDQGMGRRTPSRRRVPEDHARGARAAEPGHGPRPADPVRVPRFRPRAAAGDLRRERGCHGGRGQRRTRRSARRVAAGRIGRAAPVGICRRGPEVRSVPRSTLERPGLPRRVRSSRFSPTGTKTLTHADRVRIFHGFGDPRIDWHGATHEVRREEVIVNGGSPRIPSRQRACRAGTGSGDRPHGALVLASTLGRRLPPSR